MGYIVSEYLDFLNFRQNFNTEEGVCSEKVDIYISKLKKAGPVYKLENNILLPNSQLIPKGICY